MKGPSLVVVTGKMAGQSLSITKETMIGRSAESDIRLTGIEVSRKHCRIIPGEGLVIDDLGSRNGTFVNGERLKEPTALKDGDVITVCNMRFVVVLTPQNTPSPNITTLKDHDSTTKLIEEKSPTQDEADKALRKLFGNR